VRAKHTYGYTIAHAVPESTAQNKVFIYEPYLIPQMAELISPENQVDTVSLLSIILYSRN
jgi:hypothetical protein